MNKAQLFFSIAAIIAGVFIMGISLSVANPASAVENNLNSSQRQFYFGRQILPDHIAYPLIVMLDRAQLETSPPLDKAYLQTKLGTERSQQAVALLEKDKPDLALKTLIRSQKYFLHASEASMSLDLNMEERSSFANSLTDFCEFLMTTKPNFDDAAQAEINQLIKECDAVKLRLDQSLSL